MSKLEMEKINVKKSVLIISILAVLMLAASPAYTKLYRLTIINKSGMELAISLISEDGEDIYFLRVPEGDRVSPTETIFTIAPNTYSIKPYYVEPWDPVYGYSCEDPGAKTLVAERNIRLTFTECGYIPRDGGQPSMWKFNARGVKVFDWLRERLAIPGEMFR